MQTDIEIIYYQPSSQEEIESKWSALLENASPSPFHNIYWISSWLKSLPSIPFVLEASKVNETVGLALFCEKQKRSLWGTHSKQLWLHKFGEQDYDQIWIEHNDFLLAEIYKDVTRVAMLRYLKENKNLWDELYLGMATVEVIDEFTNVLGCKRIDVNSPDFSVDLSNRRSSDDYLKDLSKNTRSQINRSLKLLSKQGTVKLNLASTPKEKNIFLDEIAKIHIEKWGETPFGSGFSNSKFKSFHFENLRTDTEGKYFRLYSLDLDNTPLAYVYIIKNSTEWFFYLSAIKKNQDNKIKIGLVIHTLLINEAITNGANCYSFLAGEARYKRSMSNTPESIQQLVCFYRPTLSTLCKEKLRTLKNQLSRLYSNYAKSSE